MAVPAPRPVSPGSSSATTRETVLIVVTLASFLSPFMGSSVTIALPTIGREFSLDAVTLGWIPTAYLLAQAITLIPAGRLADIYGRRRIFMLGACVFAVTSLLASLSPSAPFFIACRVAQGVAGAMVFSTSVALLTSVFPPNQKGRVLGINSATVYVGLSIGPTVGGIMTETFGWRSVFLVMVPLAVLAAVLTFTKVQGEWAEARGDTFDAVGAALYGIALLTIMYGFTSLPNWSGLLLIAVGAVALSAFLLWESRAACPVLDIRIFRHNATLTLSNLAVLINYSATAASAFLLSLYLQEIKGLTAEGAGLIMVAQPVVQAVFSPLTGRLSDTIEPRLLASSGMALTAVGLFLFATLDQATPTAFVFLILMLLGFGFALFSSPNTNAVMSAVEPRHYGVASAMLSTMRNLGQTLSTGIAMLVFSLLIGRVEITPAVHGAFVTSMQILFAFFGALCVLGIFASLARGNVRR